MPDDSDSDDQTETPFDLDDLSEAFEDALPEGVVDAFEEQADEKGGYEAFAKLLYNDNKKQRDKLRELQQENKRLKEQGPEDQVVLDPETSEAIERRLPDEKGVDDLPDLLDERNEFEQQIEERKRRERVQEASDAAGVDPEALLDLEPDIEVEVQEVDGEDGTQRVALAKGKDDGDDVPLDEYLSDQYPRFESVLFSDDSSEGEGEDEDEQSSTSVPPPSDEDEGDSSAGNEDGDPAADYISNQRWAVPDDE